MNEIATEKEPRCCQHPGCSRLGTQYFHPTDDPDKQSEPEYFCAEHAQAHGYCHMCGSFWAGIEAFDLSPSGLCPNCRGGIDGKPIRGRSTL